MEQELFSFTEEELVSYPFRLICNLLIVSINNINYFLVLAGCTIQIDRFSFKSNIYECITLKN